MLRVLFFGRLREIAGTNALELDARFASIEDLRAAIARTAPELAEALRDASVRVAVDQTIAAGDIDISAAREVAFMPPLSGG